MQPSKHKKINKPANSSPAAKNNGDKRFKATQYDPKFVAPSKNIGKIKIDKRFSKMMKDPEFKISSKVDKYGRAADPGAEDREHLKDYYYEEGSMEEEVENN